MTSFVVLFVFMAYLAAAQAALLRAQAHRETTGMWAIKCSVEECACVFDCRPEGGDGTLPLCNHMSNPSIPVNELPVCNSVQRAHPDEPFKGTLCFHNVPTGNGIVYDCLGTNSPTTSPTTSQPSPSPTTAAPTTKQPTASPTPIHWWDATDLGPARLRLKYDRFNSDESSEFLFELETLNSSPTKTHNDLQYFLERSFKFELDRSFKFYYGMGGLFFEITRMSDVRMSTANNVFSKHVLDFEQKYPYRFCEDPTRNGCDPFKGEGSFNIHDERSSVGLLYWCSTEGSDFPCPRHMLMSP
jgi:hypothetical protein